MTLSVIIITKNEEAHIGACLDSVSFADEIVVLDSGSSDRTREIAREKGAHVVETSDWPGFGPQKNRALDLATQEWVLSVDADERVTPALQQAIMQAIERSAMPVDESAGRPAIQAFRIARLSNFCGRWIRHSGWWPDHVVRLFKRGTARFSDAAVHERVLAQGPIGTLDAHFLHYPYADMDALIAKVNRYSTDAARMMHEKGRRSSVPGAVGHALWTFIRIYLIRKGFLDGREGFILAVTASAGSFFRYAKLYFMGRAK